MYCIYCGYPIEESYSKCAHCNSGVFYSKNVPLKYETGISSTKCRDFLNHKYELLKEQIEVLEEDKKPIIRADWKEPSCKKALICCDRCGKKEIKSIFGHTENYGEHTFHSEIERLIKIGNSMTECGYPTTIHLLCDDCIRDFKSRYISSKATDNFYYRDEGNVIMSVSLPDYSETLYSVCSLTEWRPNYYTVITNFLGNNNVFDRYLSVQHVLQAIRNALWQDNEI